MNKVSRNLLLLMCFIGLVSIEAQTFERVRFQDEKGHEFFKIDSVSFSSIETKVDSVLNSWRLSNFIAAAVDSSHVSESIKTYYFYKGQSYEFDEIEISKMPVFIGELGILNSKKNFSVQDLNTLMKTVLEKAEENGYPFARAGLSNIQFDNGMIKSSLELKLNEKFEFDSLIVIGIEKVNYNLIRSVLNIKKGQTYDQRLVENLKKKLKEIPYLKSTKDPEFVFKKNKVDTYIYVEKKTANRFNGVIGFLPNSVTGETVITGDIDLSLINTLRLGEIFKFNWQRVRPEVLDLNTSLDLPFLLNTPFGLTGSLEIFRQDTSLLEVKSGVGLVYNFAAQDHFKIYYSSFDSDRLENTTQAIDLGGSNYDSYGLALELKNLDYVFNPRKGFRINFSADGGTRSFKAPSQGDSILTTLPESSDIFNLNFNGAIFIPSGKRAALVFNLVAVSRINSYLTSNELLRFGGNNSFRGFDEMSLRKTSYVYQNIEYRILTDLNSNLFLFTNVGWTETNLFNSNSNDWPYGFGAGANFDTNAGIFSISYALGAQNDNTLRLNQGKIHFGFKSLF